MDECVKAGDVCLSALRCLKQGDGSYACGYDAKGFKIVGERDARTCADNEGKPTFFCDNATTKIKLTCAW